MISTSQFVRKHLHECFALAIVSLIIVSGCGAAGISSDAKRRASWPMERQSLSRAASSSIGTDLPLRLKWEKKFHGGILGQSLAASEDLLIATGDQYISCFDIDSGKKIWHRDFGNDLIYSPIISGRRVVCGLAVPDVKAQPGSGLGGRLEILSVDLNSGLSERLEVIDEQFGINDPPALTIVDGWIVVLSASGRLHCLPLDGDAAGYAYDMPANGSYSGPIVTGKNAIYFVCDRTDGKTGAVCFDVQSRSVRWQTVVNEQVVAEAYEDGVLVLIPDVTAPGGPEAGESETGDGIETDADSRSEASSPREKKILACSASNGEVLWVHSIRPKWEGLAPMDSVSIDDDGLVFFGVNSVDMPVIEAVDIRTGTRRWETEWTGNKIGRLISPVIAGDVGWVLSMRGQEKGAYKLGGWSLATGDKVEEIECAGAVKLISAGGMLIALSYDGKSSALSDPE